MVKLIINTPGFFLDIPGIQPFRTPAEVDVTSIVKKGIRTVLNEMNRHGVGTYSIVFEGGFSVRQKELEENSDSEVKEDKKVNTNNQVSNNDEILSVLKEHKNSIDSIKDMLNKLLDSGSVIPTKEKEKIKKIIDDEVNDFIPSINIDDIKVRGSSSSRVINSRTNLENVESLQNITKKM